MHLFLCAIAALALAISGAQSADAQVLLTGTVREFDSGDPIPDAFVEIIAPGNAFQRLAGRTTDDRGVFTFELDRKRAYRIRASRLGFQPSTTVVLWRDDFEAIQIEIRLATEVIVLAPIEVVARAGARASPVLDNYQARLATGLGNFITRDQIQRTSPQFITDMIAQLPGVRMQSTGRGTRRSVYINRGTHQCPAEIYLDGHLLNRQSRSGMDFGFSLDDAVSPAEVEAIEVYLGIATVPAEFLSPRADCGVVAVWTARGDAGGRR